MAKPKPIPPPLFETFADVDVEILLSEYLITWLTATNDVVILLLAAELNQVELAEDDDSCLDSRSLTMARRTAVAVMTVES